MWKIVSAELNNQVQVSPIGHEEPAYAKVKLNKLSPIDFYVLF